MLATRTPVCWHCTTTDEGSKPGCHLVGCTRLGLSQDAGANAISVFIVNDESKGTLAITVQQDPS
jgi:hypothetical protein